MYKFRSLYLFFPLAWSMAQGGELTEIRATIKQGVLAEAGQGSTTPFVGARSDFFIQDLPFQPQAELSLVAPGSTRQNQPRVAFGAALRLDVLEFVPFVAARVGVPLRTDDLSYAMLTAGVERLFRNDWFWLVECGAQAHGIRASRIDGMIIFGFGLRYSLTELV